MKITSILLLTFALNQASAFNSVKDFGTYAETPEAKFVCGPVKQVQDRTEGAFNFMMTELARVHKGVYGLPFSYDHIKANFMPQIEAQRLVLAPHYPTRAPIGDDQVLAKETFKLWFVNYPQESVDYIAYVDQFIVSHQ